MNINPIIIIDDDKDDLEFISQAFIELKVENEIIIFDDGLKFLDFMQVTNKKAFFILCDINMGKINGLDLKKTILDDERLRLKCIPFLFFSTSMATGSILKAYSFGVQGYFIKPSSPEEYKDMFYSMISYWNYSQHPNK
jgi:CheY-like chemotaxis protein